MQRHNGFPTVADDRRHLDGTAFDEKCRLGRIALRIDHLAGLKPLPYLAVTSPRQHYSRIEDVSSSSRFRQFLLAFAKYVPLQGPSSARPPQIGLRTVRAVWFPGGPRNKRTQETVRRRPNLR